MKITKLEVQKKNKNRVNLYLNEEFYCGLSLEAVVKYNLKVGQEIEEQKLEFLQTDSEREIAQNKAISYISKYQKTEKELKDYLIKKGFDEEIVFEVIKKLKEYSFVDDDIYAKNFIKSKSKRSGKRKLSFELKKRGIDENLINENIKEYADDSETIFPLCEKYLKNKPRDYKTKQKAYRFLSSRGFVSEDIISALNKYFKEE